MLKGLTDLFLKEMGEPNVDSSYPGIRTYMPCFYFDIKDKNIFRFR